MTPAPARVDELKKRYEENPRRFFAPLANEYRKAGDLDAAIDLCRMHLEEQPGHLSGHIVYGQALYEAGRPADAKATFEAALELDPENLIALRHLGDIAKVDGDATSARHWYQRVLDADPRNDEVMALIAGLVDRPSSTVTIAEDAPPPPAPQYAEQEQQRVSAMADLPMIETNEPVAAPSHMADIPLMDFEPTSHEAEPAPAPEPITEPTPIAASAPPAPRASIGLMDLDLDLGSETPATGDLLAGNLTPAAPSPVVEEAASVFEEGFPVADAPLNTSFDTTHELIGAADTNLGLPEPDVPVVEDASFGVDLDAPEPSTFGAVPSEPVFGEAHDAIAMESFELPAEPMVEPVAEVTAPAAPTASDFDLLFGNAPLGDVTVGGDSAGTIETADAGFVADSFIGREPTDEHIDTPAEVGATPPPFVTETMAELYLQQGFRDEALGVYRQLLEQNPGDHGLAERIRHLEQGTRSSMALDSVSEGIVHEAEEAERRRTGDIPVVSSAPVVEPVTEPTPVMAEMEPGAMMIDTTPAFLVQAPPKPAAPKGPLARDVFAMIANRRAVPSAHEAASPVPVPVHSPQAPQSPIVEPVTGGSLDKLFAAGGVNTDDESAAAAMSGAFSSTAEAAPVQGAPTYKSDNELSLNSVFGEARPTAQVQRQSTKLRFDQFFAATDDAPSSSPTVPATPAPQGEEDIAQFNDWLKGLKGS